MRIKDFADVALPDDFDLRRKKDARDLEKELLANDLDDLWTALAPDEASG